MKLKRQDNKVRYELDVKEALNILRSPKHLTLGPFNWQNKLNAIKHCIREVKY